MSNEKFEKYREARVNEVLNDIMTREQLARRIVELEAVVHAVQGVIIKDDWEVSKFLARQELNEKEM